MAFSPQLFQDLYPFKPHTFKLPVSSLNYSYVDEGPRDAEAVLMVHGNPTWSFYYRNVIKELSGDFRTIVPDHIGCGLSAKPTDERYTYTLDSRVADLTALMDSLGYKNGSGKRVNMVVHDWGGMIGLAWAARHMDLVGRVVILNTGGFRLPKTKTLPRSLWWIRNVSPFGSVAVRGFNAFAGQALKMAVVKPLDPRVASAMVAPYDNWDNRIATLRFVQDIPLGPGHPAWKTVLEVEASLPELARKEVMVAWGEQDFVFDNHFLREWQRHLPDAKMHVYPDAGHYVLEDAREEVVPLIGQFMRKEK
ncbi:MAG: alpha/beta fold hydrolase [Candidatus Methylacidiphilales bacterium]|nr:alpha/beta fold hydrolase [Candidatus Methylacidiphilales bacterium]